MKFIITVFGIDTNVEEKRLEGVRAQTKEKILALLPTDPKYKIGEPEFIFVAVPSIVSQYPVPTPETGTRTLLIHFKQTGSVQWYPEQMRVIIQQVFENGFSAHTVVI